jgi:uncharacterized membrane protein SpoIIM required for sporulation
MTGRAPVNSTDHWVQRRLRAWQQLDESLPELEDDEPVPPELALDVVRQYPEIARDLAIAKRNAPGGRVAGYLEHAYTRLHRVLFKEPKPPARERLEAFRDELPDVVAELRWHITWVILGFALAAAAGWWLVAAFPELISLFASEHMIDTVQRGQLWTDHLLNVTPSSVLSVGIFTNNIAVALTALCLGLLYGLGTLYIIGLNGLMLGGVFAFTTHAGLGARLFEFVCAHGFVELSVICISGAIGLYVGESLARPGQRTRIRALQRRIARTSGLMVLCVVFLVGAGLIEGYVSPNPSFPLPVRLAVGMAYFALLLFGLGGFRLPRRGGRAR